MLRSPHLLRTLLTLVGLGLLPASAAHAQIQVQILSFDGRSSVDLTDLGSATGAPISLGECNGPAQIEWRFTNVDATRANLRFFTGTMCDSAAVRNDTTNTSCRDLEVTVATENRSQVDVTVGVDQLIDCSGMSGTDTIWVLALNQDQDEVTGTGQSVSFPLAYDFVGPAAPSGLEATNGEDGSQLEWSSSDSQVSQYEIYRIAGGCRDGVPTVDPSTASPVRTLEGNVSSALVPFPEEDPFMTEYAIAVRAIDRSENPSDFSAIQCVRKIDVTSFWDAYCETNPNADACTGGSGCAVSPVSARPSHAAWLLLMGLGLATLRRMR